MTINNRLSLIINELGLNNNSFSLAIGVNSTIIHNITRGRNAPGFDVLSKIALSFGNIDMNWLITGLGDSHFKPVPEINTQVISKLPASTNPDPPDCEKCNMKDAVIESQRNQIEVLHKLINHLEEHKRPVVNGQKRKAS